jgi:aspartyl-tRNA(Asn)/glutamyl-tRNA(Gln) amidotransferase subunit C
MSDINIKKITKLAKIKTSEEENINLKNQLGKIIDWIDILSEAQTDNIDILNNVHSQTLSLFDDNIKMEENIEEVMNNATNDKYNYFTVPKVIK